MKTLSAIAALVAVSMFGISSLAMSATACDNSLNAVALKAVAKTDPSPAHVLGSPYLFPPNIERVTVDTFGETDTEYYVDISVDNNCNILAVSVNN
jgi:hypothetical protein